MFRTLEEHAERFHGKTSFLARLVRFKVVVIGSVFLIGTLLSLIMSLE